MDIATLADTANPPEEVLAALSTADRLRLIASVVERHPTNWNQSVFFELERSWGGDEDGALGRGFTCDTTCCVAGWATCFTATADREALGWARDGEEFEANGSFAAIGRQSLGLDSDTADWLFYDGALMRLRPAEMARLLRGLAEVPEPRSPDVAMALLAKIKQDALAPVVGS